MKFQKFSYEVKATVVFTRSECHDLVKLAKVHYDAVCVEAGLKRGESHYKVGVADKNGFLAQMLMFSKPLDLEVVATWPFANFDITLKILEQRDMLRHTANNERMRRYDGLWARIHEVCDGINAEWKRLNDKNATQCDEEDGTVGHL